MTNNLLLGTDDGRIYLQDDDGNWNNVHIQSPGTAFSNHMQGFPGNACLANGNLDRILTSDDGITWEVREGIIPDTFTDQLTRDRNSNALFVRSSAEFTKIYKSIDNGATWTLFVDSLLLDPVATLDSIVAVDGYLYIMTHVGSTKIDIFRMLVDGSIIEHVLEYTNAISPVDPPYALHGRHGASSIYLNEEIGTSFFNPRYFRFDLDTFLLDPCNFTESDAAPISTTGLPVPSIWRILPLTKLEALCIIRIPTDTGVFRTENGGQSWFNVLHPGADFDSDDNSLQDHNIAALTATHCVTAQKATEGFYWISDDGGLTWTKLQVPGASHNIWTGIGWGNISLQSGGVVAEAMMTG